MQNENMDKRQIPCENLEKVQASEVVRALSPIVTVEKVVGTSSTTVATPATVNQCDETSSPGAYAIYPFGIPEGGDEQHDTDAAELVEDDGEGECESYEYYDAALSQLGVYCVRDAVAVPLDEDDSSEATSSLPTADSEEPLTAVVSVANTVHVDAIRVDVIDSDDKRSPIETKKLRGLMKWGAAFRRISKKQVISSKRSFDKDCSAVGSLRKWSRKTWSSKIII